MAHDVFVSYSQRDKAIADAVVAGLEREGVRCWIAPRDIIPGSNWGGAIVDAIGAATAMVLLLSTDSNESRQVLREVERAVACDTVIIPFRIDEVEATGAMAYFLGTEHWMDALSPPMEAHIADLARTVKSLVGSRPKPGPGPEPPATEPEPVPKAAAGDGSSGFRITKRQMLWGGGIAALVAVAVLVGVLIGGGGGGGTTTTEGNGTAIATTTTTSPTTTTTTLPATTTTTTPPATTTTTTPPTTTTTEASPSVALPDGYQLFDGSAQGFVVGLPSSWAAFDLTSDDMAVILQEMQGILSPDEIDEIRQMMSAGAEVPMMAFEPAGERNVAIVAIPLGPFDTLDVLEASLADELDSMAGIEVLSFERVEVNGLDAIQLAIRTEAGDGAFDQVQYYVFGPEIGYIVTFTGPVGGDNAVFETIMGTFTLVD